MPKKGKKDESKLSPLGQKVEKAISGLLDDVTKDTREKTGKYTLTDSMKILDRALKLESIRLKVADDNEGAFFNEPDEEGGGDDEP